MQGAMKMKENKNKQKIHVRALALLTLSFLTTACAPAHDGDNAGNAKAGTEKTARQPVNSNAATPAAPPAESDISALNAADRCIGSSCNFDPLGARNDEEARWLKAKGYPSSQEAELFKTLSDAQLKRRADAGDLAAMVFYGERMAAAGDTRNGLQYVHDSIRQGSVYGYYGMSEIYKDTPGLKNIVDSAAYLRVAYLLGDSKASAEMQRRYPDLSRLEQVAIDERAMSLYRSFAAGAQPNPRP